MDLEKLGPILDQLESLSPAEVCWLIRNATYHLVSYYDENNKGPIYDGSYDQIQIEQATRLQQDIRNKVDIFGQVFEHRNFDNDYFEDLLTDRYYSRLKEAKEQAEEYKEKAWKYDSLCDEG